MRLIDVDEVKLQRGFFEKVDNVPKFYEWLGTLPTVDAEPIRHGHWENGKDIFGTFYRCSACGEAFGDIEYGYTYCPSCGAKMDDDKLREALDYDN